MIERFTEALQMIVLFLVVSLILWIVTGGPVWWLILHVILNWK